MSHLIKFVGTQKGIDVLDIISLPEDGFKGDVPLYSPMGPSFTLTWDPNYTRPQKMTAATSWYLPRSLDPYHINTCVLKNYKLTSQ